MSKKKCTQILMKVCQDLMAQLVLTQREIFNKPARHRHLKPLTKMFVDGGVTINIMPYTTFRKLGMKNEELLKTAMVLWDFASNPSNTQGAMHAE